MNFCLHMSFTRQKNYGTHAPRMVQLKLRTTVHDLDGLTTLASRIGLKKLLSHFVSGKVGAAFLLATILVLIFLLIL